MSEKSAQKKIRTHNKKKIRKHDTQLANFPFHE